MNVVIKVGTQAILAADSAVLESTMSTLVAQIAQLQAAGHYVVLVSSGAVGSGRRVARQMWQREYGNAIGEKQVLASLGQHELMHIYAGMFKQHGLLVSQLLLTKQDFHTRQHYLNISRLLREILAHKNIIPIINENDSVAIDELMFTDNDELAGLIGAQINADKVIILTNVRGVYDGNPADPSAQLIPLIDPKNNGWPEIDSTKSLLGRGGMLSKMDTARKLSDLGITTHIASINENNVIVRIVAGEAIGTCILPFKKKSNIKKWMAFSDQQQNGIIYINSCLFDILQQNNRALSILPVGIEKCHGDFKKGDLVDIVAPNGQKIGLGIARYASSELVDYLGLKDKPEFIHYNYLHLNIRS